MPDLCIEDLATITGGTVVWSDLPPLGGRWEPIGHSVFDARDIRPGDVLWCCGGSCWDHPAAAGEAFRRGARGIVCDTDCVPFAGGFTLKVPNTVAAVEQFITHLRSRYCGKVIVVAAGEATQRACDLIATVLRTSLQGSVCTMHNRAGRWIPTGLANIDLAQQFVVVPVPEMSKDEVLRLSSPHVAVITPAVNDDATLAVQQIAAWLPQCGHVVIGLASQVPLEERLIESAVAVGQALGIAAIDARTSIQHWLEQHSGLRAA